MQISSGKGTQSALGGERVDGVHGKQAGMEAVEPTAPLDEVFPESAPGLCPERGPILPEGMGHSSWAYGCWAGGRAVSPCRPNNMEGQVIIKVMILLSPRQSRRTSFLTCSLKKKKLKYN